LEVADRFRGAGVPVIAGGLIRTQEIVERIRAAGCRAVSTTNVKLWEMNLRGK
jgi:glycerol-3-phosphate responsive antiterminator